jgi:hypothetical protein
VSFAVITLCVASQRVFIVVVYFIIDSVRKLLDTPSYVDPTLLKTRYFWVLCNIHAILFRGLQMGRRRQYYENIE